MTKQEEIWEGIARELFTITHPFEELIEESYYPKWKNDVDVILKFLHSQGVVIRVDRECRSCSRGDAIRWNHYNCVIQCHHCGEQYTIDEIVAGFVAVETIAPSDATR